MITKPIPYEGNGTRTGFPAIFVFFIPPGDSKIELEVKDVAVSSSLSSSFGSKTGLVDGGIGRSGIGVEVV